MKKKIIHIVEAFGGGVFSVLTDLMNNTADEYDVTVLYGIRPQTPKDISKYLSDKVNVIPIEDFTSNINIIKDIKAILKVRKYIKQLKPDVIHLHSSKAGAIGRIATSHKKVKILYSPHGFAFLKTDISSIHRRIYYLIEKALAHITKMTIIACSKSEYKIALKLTKSVVLLESSIDINRIDKVKCDESKKNGNLRICTVGRIEKQKNPELFNMIAKELPENQFTWIGDGKLKEKLNAKNIEITGWKEPKETIELLNNNDVFILTSLWEGLPISLLEAMYLRKICIISSEIEGIDVIKNNVNGYIAKNDKEYVKIISNLGNENVSEMAYNDVKNKYNIKEYIKKYQKIINN